MTGKDFEQRIDALLASGATGDALHRGLDRLTNEALSSLGGGYARGVAKWLAAIDGAHSLTRPKGPMEEHG